MRWGGYECLYLPLPLLTKEGNRKTLDPSPTFVIGDPVYMIGNDGKGEAWIIDRTAVDSTLYL